MIDKELLKAILNCFERGKGQAVLRSDILAKVDTTWQMPAIEAALKYLCDAKIVMTSRDRAGVAYYRLTSDRPYSMINEAKLR
ncbi:MAG: hypothetical protein H0X38_03100 [Planctomycetes bacterium]|nr:hypothetical protein [Planctomycetota bacterium]